MNTLSWELLDGPSDLTNFDLKSGTINGGKPEEKGSAPDGKPISRHTYGGQVYHPGLKKSFMFGGALCGGAGTADDRWWSVTPSGNYKKLGGKGAWTQLGMSAQYDPGTGNIFLALAGNITEYIPSTNTKINRTNNASSNWGQVAAIDSTRNNLFVFGHDSGNGASTARIFNTKKKTQTTVTLTGDLSILGRTGIGLQYVPELDLFAAWIEGSDLYFIDPDTFYITRYKTTGAPAKGSSKNGIYGRFAYSAKYEGFIVVTQTDENVFFLKLPKKQDI